LAGGDRPHCRRTEEPIACLPRALSLMKGRATLRQRPPDRWKIQPGSVTLSSQCVATTVDRKKNMGGGAAFAALACRSEIRGSARLARWFARCFQNWLALTGTMGKNNGINHRESRRRCCVSRNNRCC
jgi:hypothetical protein